MSIYNKLLHAEELRLLGGIIGAALMATAINLFIVPQGFYAGGAYGMCQVIRTLLVTRAGLTLPFDLAGLLYLMVNLPLFYLAYRGLGRTFFLRATVVTVCNSVFLDPLSRYPHHHGPADQLHDRRYRRGLCRRSGAELRLLHRRTGYSGTVP